MHILQPSVLLPSLPAQPFAHMPGCACLLPGVVCVCLPACPCSYEHCIANMFVIPLAMRLGAPISLHTFLVKNLIPATLGNIIGGAVFVAMAMALSFGSLEKRLNAAGARAYSRLGGPKCGLVVFGAANAPPAGAAADSCCDTSGASDTDSVAARAEIRSVAAHPAAV